MDNIEVSIVCTAYNHEKYIGEALESFVKQKTDFRFEVLVNDDASTDHTADIIREYERKYPDIIRGVYQTENQYYKVDSIVSRILVPMARGKYIAMCEGDDYWTDMDKLQKQYDVMEAHPEIDMCAHGAACVFAQSKQVNFMICPKDHDTVLTTAEVIDGGGGYLATNSLFYRKELENEDMKFLNVMKIDYVRQIHGSLRGGIYYLSDVMSAYRWMSESSWSRRVELNPKLRAPSLLKTNQMLALLNEDTDHKYDEIIKWAIARRQYEVYEFNQDFKSIMQEPYRTLYQNRSFKEKLKTQIRCRVPGFYTIRRIIKQMKK